MKRMLCKLFRNWNHILKDINKRRNDTVYFRMQWFPLCFCYLRSCFLNGKTFFQWTGCTWSGHYVFPFAAWIKNWRLLRLRCFESLYIGSLWERICLKGCVASWKSTYFLVFLQTEIILAGCLIAALLFGYECSQIPTKTSRWNPLF